MYHPVGAGIADTAASIAKREAVAIACRSKGVPETALSVCIDKVLAGISISEAVAFAKGEHEKAQQNTKLFIAGGAAIVLIGLFLTFKR